MRLIDEVVEELKNLKMSYYLTIANTGDELNDFAYIHVGNAIDKAIEIVKQGVVSDDVCEWNGEQSRLVTYTRFTTACGYNFDLETNNELLKAFRYCPFCGKKLKVVE